MGESARYPARLPVAAPASTQANSKATSASARFFGPSMKPPCAGVHEDAGDAGFVEGLEQGVLLGRPFVSVACACGYQAGDRPARDGANRLHQHLQVIAVREAPQDLPDVVAGQGAQVVGGVVKGHGWGPFSV